MTPYEKPKRKRKPSQRGLLVVGIFVSAFVLLLGSVLWRMTQVTSDSDVDNQAVAEVNTTPVDPQGELVAYEGGWWLAQWAGPYTMVRQYVRNDDGTFSMTRNDQTTEPIAVFDMSINNSGVTLVATADGRVNLYRPDDDTVTRVENNLSRVTFSPDGTQYALMNAANGYYAVYQTDVYGVVYDDRLPVSSNWQLALGNNSRTVAAYNTREVLSSEMRPDTSFVSEDVMGGLVSDVTFMADGSTVVVTRETITIFERDGGMRVYPTYSGAMHDGEVSISQDEKWMAVSNNREGGVVTLYRLATDPLAPDSTTPPATFGNTGSTIVGMAFSPDNTQLGIAYSNGSFVVVDLARGLQVGQVN